MTSFGIIFKSAGLLKSLCLFQFIKTIFFYFFFSYRDWQLKDTAEVCVPYEKTYKLARGVWVIPRWKKSLWCQPWFALFWKRKIPYFLVWLVAEVSDDWNLSAACAETPIHLLEGRLQLATKLKPCAQQYVLFSFLFCFFYSKLYLTVYLLISVLLVIETPPRSL